MAPFNGLGMNLGNLSVLSAQKRDPSAPRTSPAKRARPGMATEGTARTAHASSARDGRYPPPFASSRERRDCWLDIDGTGAIQHIWMTPTGPLAVQHTAHLLGRSGHPSVECPVGDFFACGWKQVCAGVLAPRVREPWERVQLLLGDAVPQALQDDADQHRRWKR